MWTNFIVLSALSIILARADLPNDGNRTIAKASLKPLSVCCDVPELASPEAIAACSDPKPSGACAEVSCLFEKSNLLSPAGGVERDAWRRHLRAWAARLSPAGPGAATPASGWRAAAELAVRECADAAVRQHLDAPCEPYDLFACAGIAFIKKCPTEAWKC